MVKRKLSGQTLAIIILGVLLLITITFGGVYAYYTARTSQVTGKILMANLNIALGAGPGESDQSEIIIYNEGYIVPGQILNNTPLVIRNLSTVEILLVVAYELNAQKTDEVDAEGKPIPVIDEFINPVLGLGCEYYNSKDPTQNIVETKEDNEVYNYDWYDFVFEAKAENKYYRCLVSRKSIPKYTESNKKVVTVIGENKFSLHKKMGSEYKQSTLSFKFQAYAIGASTNFGISSSDTPLEKCNKIVKEVYASQGNVFLKFNK